MRRLQRGDDALEFARQAERREGLAVGDAHVLGASGVAQPCVLRADAGVVEPGGHAVRLLDLAVGVLHDVRHRAVEHADAAAADGRGVPAGLDPIAGGLDADQPDVFVGDEGVELADGVGASADAGGDRVGEAPGFGEHLLAGLAPDDRLEVAHHHRVGVGADGAADDVVGVADVGDPVAYGFADGLFQGAGAGGDGADFGAEHPHSVDVGGLAAHILLAHIDDALDIEQGADGRGGDAVLSRAGLGDDAALAHALGEQPLP